MSQSVHSGIRAYDRGKGKKLPSASVSVTAQGNRGSWKFTALCHQRCKVWLGWRSGQSQEGGAEEIQEIDNQYHGWEVVVVACQGDVS